MNSCCRAGSFKNSAAQVLIRAVVILLFTVQLLACGQSEETDTVSIVLPEQDSPQRKLVPVVTTLEKIKERGKLVILTTNRPTTYYYDRDNELTGPEYDMTQSFAKSLQLDVEYKVYESTNELLMALRNNEGDIAASALTVSKERGREFDYGPVYQKTNEYLVCHRKKNRIKKIEQLNNLEVVIAAGTNYLVSVKEYPDMAWVSDDHLDTIALLKETAEGGIECTVSDSTLFDIERRYYMEIQNKYTLAKDQSLAWVLNKHNNKLKQAVIDWFKIYKKEELPQMLDKYYGFVEIFDYVDTHKFLNRVKRKSVV